MLKNRFNSVSHFQKQVQFFESYFWVVFCDFFQFLWVIFWKKVQFFESFVKMSSIFWVMSKKNFESYDKKRGSILWVIFKKGFNSLGHIVKECDISLSQNFQQSRILEVRLKKKKVNPLSHFQFLESYFTKRFNSVSNIQKKSILWVTFKKKSS